MNEYNFESAKGRFGLTPDIVGYPRIVNASKGLDGYGQPKYKADKSQNKIHFIGFMWHVDGAFTLTTEPEEIYEELKLCCQANPELPLHPSNFYLLENDEGVLRRLISGGQLVLGHSYTKAREWTSKSDTPKLRVSDKVESSTSAVKPRALWSSK
tara:strand:+ start:2256 stop:2720 length:465 start_codon:yes stop_codon:yes gene_type:complete